MASQNDNIIDGAKTLNASEFKAKCLQLMDEIAETGGEIVITKRGKPVAKLVPYRKPLKAPFGKYRGLMQLYGDIDEDPVELEWDAITGKNWELP